ncbi:uncharacterized protein [Antedon mediterranea]|uniref:uncharacterized protein n=1 Tax=Antedon mediterranea TaxID=105859 RepID=UPI003AF6A7E1
MGPPAKARGGFFGGRASHRPRGRGGWRGRGRGNNDPRFNKSRSRSPPSPKRRSNERSSRMLDTRSHAHDNTVARPRDNSPTTTTRLRHQPRSPEKSYEHNDKWLSGSGKRHRDEYSSFAVSDHDWKNSNNTMRPGPMTAFPIKSSSRPRSVTPPLPPNASRHQIHETNLDLYYGRSTEPVFSHDENMSSASVTDAQQQCLAQPSTGMPPHTNTSSGSRYAPPLPMVTQLNEDPTRKMKKSFQQKEFKDTESLRITVDNDHYKTEKPSALERLGPPVEINQHQQRSSKYEFQTGNQIDNSSGPMHDEKQRKIYDEYHRKSKTSVVKNSSSRSSSSSSRRSSRSPSPDKGGKIKKHQASVSQHSFKAEESMKYTQSRNNDPRLRVSTHELVEDPPSKIDNKYPHASKLQQAVSDDGQNSVQKLLNDLSHITHSSFDANKMKEKSKSLTETLKEAAGLSGPTIKPAKSILKRTKNPAPIVSQPEPDKPIKSILKNVPTTAEPELSVYSSIFSRNIEGSLPGLDLLDEPSEENLKSNRFGFPSIDDEEEFLYGDDETENEQHRDHNDQYNTKNSTEVNYQSPLKESEEKYVPQFNSSEIAEELQVTNQPDFQNTQVQKILSAIGFDFDLAKKIQQQKKSEETSSTEQKSKNSTYIEVGDVKPDSKQAQNSKDVPFGTFDQSASFLSSGFDGGLDTLIKEEATDNMRKSMEPKTAVHESQSKPGPNEAFNYNDSHIYPPSSIQYANYPTFPPRNPPVGIVHPPIHGFPPIEMQHMMYSSHQSPFNPTHGQFNANPYMQQFPYYEYSSTYGYQQQQQQQHPEDGKINFESHSRSLEKSKKHKRKSRREISSDNDDDDIDRRKRPKYASDDSESDGRKKQSKTTRDRPVRDIEKETNRRLGLVNMPTVVSTEYLSSEDELEQLNERQGTVNTDSDDERDAKKQAVLEVKEKFEKIARQRPVTRKELEDDIKEKTLEILKKKKESVAKNKELTEKKKQLQDEKAIYLRRMEMLEEELCRLRKQQSELIRKRNYRRDSKDPVLMENTMLQDAIANQIHQLRRDYTEKKRNESAKKEKSARENRSISVSPEKESSKSSRLSSSEPNEFVRKRSSFPRNGNRMSPQRQDTLDKEDRSKECKDIRRSSRDSSRYDKRKYSPKRSDSREDGRKNKAVDDRDVGERRHDSKRSNQEEKRKHLEENIKQEERKQLEKESVKNKPKEKFQFEFSYFDPGSHFCKMCKMSLARLNEVFIHLHSKKHLQKCDPFDRPWMSDMKANPHPSSSKTVAAPLKGVDFMMPVNGFYCKLCKNFFGDAACSAEHLKSVEHNMAYQKYIDENPLYEKELELIRAAALGKQDDDKPDPGSIKVTKKEGGFGKFAFKNEDCMKDVKQEISETANIRQPSSNLLIYEGPKLPPELQVRKSVDIFQPKPSQKNPSSGKKMDKYGDENKEVYLPGEGDIAAAFSGKEVSQPDNMNKKHDVSKSVSSKMSGAASLIVTTTATAPSANIPKPAFIGRMPGRKTVSRGRGKPKLDSKIEKPATKNEKSKEAQQMAHIAKEMQAHMARAQLAAKQQLEKVQKDEALAKSMKEARENAMLEAAIVIQRSHNINQEMKTRPAPSNIIQLSGDGPPPPCILKPTPQCVAAVQSKELPAESFTHKKLTEKDSIQSPLSIAPPGMSPHNSPVSNIPPEEDLYSIDDMFMEDGTEIPGMDSFMSTSSMGVKVKPPPPVSKNKVNTGPKETLTTSSKESIYGLFFSGK